MVAAHTYASAGKCIYCDEPPFGDEHIIPLYIGGNLLLPDASCRQCEITIGRFEDHCEKRFFKAARAHLGYPGRKSGRVPKNIHTDVAGVPVKIPVSEHPGYCVSLLFWPPRILLGLAVEDAFNDITGHVRIWALRDDADERQRVLNRNITIAKALEAMTFARQLAKIGHAYAVAEVARLGLTGFAPYLLPLILGEAPSYPAYFVGGRLNELPPFEELPPRSSERHELGLYTEERHDGINLLVVKIRLFSDFDTPTYDVVAGAIDDVIPAP